MEGSTDTLFLKRACRKCVYGLVGSDKQGCGKLGVVMPMSRTYVAHMQIFALVFLIMISRGMQHFYFSELNLI